MEEIKSSAINGSRTNGAFFTSKDLHKCKNKPAALLFLDNDGIIVMLEGSGLEELQLNKYELIGGHINEEFAMCPLILKVINKAIENREESAVCEISKMKYEIFLTYTYKKKDEITGIIIQIIKTVSERSKIIDVNENNCFEQLFEKSPDAIVILDNENNIIKSNNGFENLFGYENHEITGKNIFGLIQPEHLFSEISIIKNTIDNGHFVKLETERSKRNGINIEVSLIGHKIDNGDNNASSYHIYRDITERKQNDESIKNALLEKEMLLKEIHHRVKNNLQIVSSLLYLQTKSLKDKNIINIFLESQNRVKSIALIHEKLYQSTNLSRIDFERYLRVFIPHLFQTFGKTDGNVSYKIKASNIFLSTDTAIPCGLIVNEIVTNSLKYAFSNETNGEISIELIYHNNNNVTMIIKDDGSGIPENISFSNAKTLGLQIISILVKQLSGTVEINNQKGTTYKITFPFIEYKFK